MNATTARAKITNITLKVMVKLLSDWLSRTPCVTCTDCEVALTTVEFAVIVTAADAVV